MRMSKSKPNETEVVTAAQVAKSMIALGLICEAGPADEVMVFESPLDVIKYYKGPVTYEHRANHPTYNPWGTPSRDPEETPRINYDKGLDDEKTPKGPPPIMPAPAIIRDPRDMVLARTDQLIMIHGHKPPQCYLCATPKQVELRRDRKTGIIVCTPCAILHFET